MLNMKRILLVVTIGLSVAPPVMAGDSVSTTPAQAPQVGQMSAPNPNGISCSRQFAFKGSNPVSNGTRNGAVRANGAR